MWWMSVVVSNSQLVWIWFSCDGKQQTKKQTFMGWYVMKENQRFRQAWESYEMEIKA